MMHEYPGMSRAMNLVAEHRVRALQTSAAWQAKHAAKTEKQLSGLGSRLEKALEVRGGCVGLRPSRTTTDCF